MFIDIISVFLVLLLAIGLAIAGLSLILSLTASPSAAQIAALTSSSPDERLIATYVCNASIKGAVPSTLAQMIFQATGSKAGADAALGAITRMSGGLWVGGRLFLTSHRVIFQPNALNRAAHHSLSDIVFRLTDIQTVSVRSGFVGRLVDFQTAGGTLTIRRYRIKALIASVTAARAAVT